MDNNSNVIMDTTIENKTIFDDLKGTYRGNVTGVLLNIGYLTKTGNITIESTNNNVTITCSSLLNNELTETFLISDIEKYFTFKNINNNTKEEHVAFQKYDDGSYSLFFDSMPGKKHQLVLAYQFKFYNGSLTAFRIQQYNTQFKEELLYSLEITNIEKIIVNDARKFDWNF